MYAIKLQQPHCQWMGCISKTNPIKCMHAKIIVIVVKSLLNVYQICFIVIYSDESTNYQGSLLCPSRILDQNILFPQSPLQYH